MIKYKVERGVKLSKADIIPNDYNPNKTKPRQQSAIAESLKKYGQLLELVVRPNDNGKYTIVDGEHRYDELGDEVYCNIVHGLSDADAKKLTVILNETRGEADKIELAQLLSSLTDEFDFDELMVGLPYESNELEELIKLAEVDWEQFEDSPYEAEVEIEDVREDLKHECPSCGHKY